MGKNLEILPGQKFGRLTILKQQNTLTSNCGRKYRMVSAICDCGIIKDYKFQYLTQGHTKSCGCYMFDRIKETNISHKDTINKTMTPEYRTWRAMRQRCNNPKNNRYVIYGGRGIKVCERWQNSYENFLLDMGRKCSLNDSIDRINPDGDYEPSNCRWATSVEQANNKRKKTRENVSIPE